MHRDASCSRIRYVVKYALAATQHFEHFVGGLRLRRHHALIVCGITATRDKITESKIARQALEKRERIAGQA
jgi:hypothetical protein